MLKLPPVSRAAVSLAASPWWRHQMETFSAFLAICAGNSPVNVWVHNREALVIWDTIAPNDVTVMIELELLWFADQGVFEMIKIVIACIT